MPSEKTDVETSAKRDVRPWTVMVYMVASDSAEMDDYAVSDLREMQKGANEHVHVAVQIKRHWPDIPQRYVISHPPPSAAQTSCQGQSGKADLQSAVGVEHSDMGDGETMCDFLDWSLKECPADRYMLVLWGHAYGLGFGRDHGDPLQWPELVKALECFRKKRNELERTRRAGSAPKRAKGQQEDGRKGILDILGANACAVSYVEAAYQLRNSANYLLASQIAVPFAGWPYDEVLESISAETEPDQLGLSVIDSYVTGLNNPLTGDRVQMSLLDLRYAGGLGTAIDGLAMEIRNAFKSDGKFAKSDGQFDSRRRATCRDSFIAAAAGDVRPLVDLKDLSRALKQDVCDPSLRRFVLKNLVVSKEKRGWLEDSAKRLQRQLDGLEKWFKPPFMLKNSAHPSLADLGGLGIYVPFVTDEQDLKRLGLDDDPFGSRRRLKGETSQETYTGLSIFADRENSTSGNWPALVYDDLNEPLPSELVDLIAGIGITSSTDRAEIAQLVLSIESTFNKLDRVLDTAYSVVMAQLSHKQSKNTRGRPENREPFNLIHLAAPTGRKQKAGTTVKAIEPTLKAWFQKLEAVLEEVERTTKKGLTQARFGLGPVVSPRGFDIPDSIKQDEGAPPRDEQQGFSIKQDEGPPPAESTTFARADVALTQPEVQPALQLFRRAADALRGLELATAELELQARESFGKAVFDERALGIHQAFAILCETATSARRTIRRVIANPAYGLGPSGAAFGLDDREELATAAGMSARNLVLLSINPLVPPPHEGEFIYNKTTSLKKPSLKSPKKTSLKRRALESARAHARRVRAPVPNRR